MNKANLKTSNQLVALVTGATGFIGEHLTCRLVRDGWRVHIITRLNSRSPDAPEFSKVIFHVHDGSMERMIDCFAQAKPDVVFHLASLTLSQHVASDVAALNASNILLGNQLLEAMKVNAVSSFINTGTFWQHYNNDDYNPVCLYAASKQAFEAILEYYIQACGIKAITLKLYDTYGPNDPRPKLLNLLSQAAATNAKLNLTEGSQLIDLVHVEDVVEAYIVAAQRLIQHEQINHEIYAVTSGHALPLRELVQLYEKVTSQKVLANWGAKAYRSREMMETWSSGKRLPGWEPRIPLPLGLKALVR